MAPCIYLQSNDNFFSYSLTSQAVLAIELTQSQLEVWLQLVAWFLIEEIGSTNITLLFSYSLTSQAVLAIDLMQSQLEVWLQLVAWFLI